MMRHPSALMSALALDCARGLLNAGKGRVFNFNNDLIAILIACYLTEADIPPMVRAMIGLPGGEPTTLQERPAFSRIIQSLDAADMRANQLLGLGPPAITETGSASGSESGRDGGKNAPVARSKGRGKGSGRSAGSANRRADGSSGKGAGRSDA